MANGQLTWAQAEQANSALRERCDTLQGEVARLGEVRDTQGQLVQRLQERLAETLAQLKYLGHPPAEAGSVHQV
ncbi:TPA: hypothetical protein VDV10_005617 [Pseudomonas aeruginosa]|nr:hypothetical protein [Pseudomonas aeruginosa]